MSKFKPSIVENHIYDLMADEKFIRGMDTYSAGLYPAVFDYLNEEGIIFQSMSTTWQDFDGETITLAWLENEQDLHMISWEVKF